MINSIDCEQRLTADEHYYLYTYYQLVNRRTIRYSDFHIHETLVEQYNNLSTVEKADIETRVNRDPNYSRFVASFNHEPWNYEKPVLWKDRDHSDYFIEQLESSHSFEVVIDCEFKDRGIDIGLYYGRDAQYSGESDAGIEIKFDKRSQETNNFYIEYQERMWNTGSWVDSGILKDDNSRFFLYGTMSGYVIFKRETLLDFYERLMDGERIPGIILVREQQHQTSKGFILKPEVWQDITLSVDQVISLLA